jgi:PAS domain S-box-containing protein
VSAALPGGVGASLLYLSAIVTAATFLGRWAIGALKATRRIYVSVDRNLTLVEQIATQFKPNEGSSLRDVIDRIERQTSINAAQGNALATSLLIGTYLSDEGGDFTYVNTEWCRATGLTEQQARGKGWIDAVDERDRARVRAEWFSAVADGRDFRMHYRVNPERPVWVDANATRVHSRHGRILGWAGTIRVTGEPVVLGPA